MNSEQSKTRGDEKVVIWSGEHHAYWRANRCGYCDDVRDAGVYTRAEAERNTGHCGPEKKIRIDPMPTLEPVPGTVWAACITAASKVPEGFALVPLIPSDEMLMAFAREYLERNQKFDMIAGRDAYPFMVAAATKPECA